MKILLFIRSLAAGGSQRQLVLLAAGLARKNHDVAVVVLYSGGPMEAALKGTSVRLIGLDKASRWDVLGPMLRFRRLLLSEQPDILYAFQPTQTAISAALLPRSIPTRLVFGIRATTMEQNRSDLLSRLSYDFERRFSGRADLIIANAHAAKTDAIERGLAADRFEVIPNGIDTDAMRPDPGAGQEMRESWGIGADEFLIGMMARLDPMKGHETFIAAAKVFAASNPDARFVCVGPDQSTNRQALQNMAKDAGLEKRLVWVADAKDVRAAYNAFNMATLSSIYGEGFPNAVGEAMACEVPVAATDVGDIKHVIGELGEVVEPRRPDLLSASWIRLRERLRNDSGLCAAARRRIIDNYGVEKMITTTESALLALRNGRPAHIIAKELQL